MKGYEQLEFEETRVSRERNKVQAQNVKCFDSNGNEIRVGNYVVAVSGEAKVKGIEGIVAEIHERDGVMSNITISTYGGKILEQNGNPFFYKVLK